MNKLILLVLLALTSTSQAAIISDPNDYYKITLTDSDAKTIGDALRAALNVAVGVEVQTDYFKCEDGFDFGSDHCSAGVFNTVPKESVAKVFEVYKKMKKAVVTASNGRINPVVDSVEISHLVCHGSTNTCNANYR